MKLEKHHAMAALLAASVLLSACEDDNYRPDAEPETSANKNPGSDYKTH
ncbi:MAG: hypothetical protein MK005_13360 [Alcanivorax sp.]|nr:hypothetical protein [Alcanivorax sp.]